MLGGTVTCLSPSSPPADDDRAVVAQTEDQNQSAASAQEAPKPPSLRRHRNATFEHRLPRSSGIIEDLDGSTRMIPSEDENLIRLAVQGRIDKGDGRPVVDPARVSNALPRHVRIGHTIDIFRVGVAEHPPAHDMDILEQPADRTPGPSPANFT